MIYTFPNGITNANQLDFTGAISPLKNPSGVIGRLMFAKNSTPHMGYKVKKWGNGTNNSSTRRRKGKH